MVEESLAWTNWWVCIRDVAFPIHLLKENSQRHKLLFVLSGNRILFLHIFLHLQVNAVEQPDIFLNYELC